MSRSVKVRTALTSVRGTSQEVDQGAIQRTISEAHELPSLKKDNWDDEGARGITRAVADSACELLRSLWAKTSEYGYRALFTPQVTALPDGSIDLHWRTDYFELLINIPAEAKKHPAFYGDDGSGGSAIKGEIHSDYNYRWIAEWMDQFQP
jgi:hypothetical protein